MMENRLNIKTAVKASGYAGFKADILRKLMLLVMSVSIMSVFLGFSVSSAAGKKSVIDDAGLIKASDEKELDKKIKNIQKDKFDVVILTVKSLDGKSAQDYADDYYDNNDYGLDNEKSGVLFLVSKGDRKYHISTKGAGIKAFTDYGIGRIKEEIKPYLSDGDYFNACDEFLNITKDFVKAYKDGTPYDTDNPYNEEIDYVILEVIALVIAFVVALISVGIMRLRMNTAKPKGTAMEYIKKGSFKLTSEKDIFMYSTVTKTAKPKDNDNSAGGSTTHVSSSGSEHGGGGGSF
ncbi:TPM domain-containing protein [Butyribacter intestini]|uniref:TPM domain-containing protein n=1 Tax=Butyribacter intestini TaxID=1703332 RepID=UPI003AB2F388